MEEMIEVHGKMVPKHIPQVHPGNSEEYWTKYFPMCYKHKKDIYVQMQELGVTFHIQGDIKENPNPKNSFPLCICGGSKWHPEMFGSLDTGKELIYVCPACGSKMRVWTDQNRSDKMKSLFLMCGPAGSGKSTWVKAQMAEAKYPCRWVSRDNVRNTFLTDADKNMFAYEDDVFDEFCHQIDVALTEVDVVYADATHLSQKARNKVLDKLHLDGVDIYPVVFNIPLDTILEQNEQRKGIGRTYVPRSVIRRMYYQFEKPTDNEKYKYKSILTVVRKD